VIHAASFTDVDDCEKDRRAAWRSNVLATRNLTEAMAKAAAVRALGSTFRPIRFIPGPEAKKLQKIRS
jgi:dTDP-4-dehydrorhamnose reductase